MHGEPVGLCLYVEQLVHAAYEMLFGSVPGAQLLHPDPSGLYLLLPGSSLQLSQRSLAMPSAFGCLPAMHTLHLLPSLLKRFWPKPAHA